MLKGILHPDDARRALDLGVDGIVVSNHGGRQVDNAIASLDALVDIREAIGPDPTVLLDSGIRTGADVFTALAPRRGRGPARPAARLRHGARRPSRASKT